MAQEFTDFEIQVDTTNVNPWGGEYTLVPIGDYQLDIVNLEQKPSKKSQQPMIVVTFEVAANEDGSETPHAKQKLFGNYSLTDKAIGRLKQLQVAAGTSLDVFRASELMGVRIIASVIHSQGEAQPDANGELQPAKTFANVANERALEQEAAPQPAKKPPVMEKPAAVGGAKPAPTRNGTTGAPRRA